MSFLNIRVLMFLIPQYWYLTSYNLVLCRRVLLPFTAVDALLAAAHMCLLVQGACLPTTCHQGRQGAGSPVPGEGPVPVVTDGGRGKLRLRGAARRARRAARGLGRRFSCEAMCTFSTFAAKILIFNDFAKTCRR